jgi:hypothetical protein
VKTFEVWDDMAYADGGRKVPATQTVNLRLGGTQVDLDLSDESAHRLGELLAPWLKAGRPPEDRTAPVPGAGGTRESREFFAGLRAWAAQVGRSDEHWTQGKGDKPKQYYYPKALIADYEKHLLALNRKVR